MCCSCLLEIYMVWEILSVITDVHHQAGLLLAYTKVLQMQDDADTVDIILRRRRRRTPRRSKLWVRAWLDKGIVTTGYHRLLPELRYEDYYNYLRIQTKQWELCECAVHRQWQLDARSESAVRAQAIAN